MAIPQQVRDDNAIRDVTGSFTLRVQDDASERPQDDTNLTHRSKRSDLTAHNSITRRCGLRGPSHHCVHA